MARSAGDGPAGQSGGNRRGGAGLDYDWRRRDGEQGFGEVQLRRRGCRLPAEGFEVAERLRDLVHGIFGFVLDKVMLDAGGLGGFKD
jgi:hypothetical protein